MVSILKTIRHCRELVWQSRFRLFTILYAVWYYRVAYMVGGALSTLLQLGSLFGMFMLANARCKNLLGKVMTRTSIPVKSLLTLYSFALVSTTWAYKPDLAGILSIQNLIMICMCYWFFSNFETFRSTEKGFLFLFIGVTVIDCIISRLFNHAGLFYHHLPAGSCGAMVFSYCIGEYLNSKRLDKERKNMLKWCMGLAATIMILSTSGGANASAVVACSLAFFLAGKLFICLMMGIIGGFVYTNQDFMEQMILFIMPGKNMEMIETGTGREAYWNYELQFANQKPLLGYGFACIERFTNDMTRSFNYPDAHSSFVGMYGSLGIVGCLLFAWHYISSFFYSYMRRAKRGFVGLTCAMTCAIVNCYTYGFLSGKACSITIMYFSVIMLMYFYSRFK